MRRLFAIVRRPLAWVPVAFVVWGWVFVSLAGPGPRFEVATGAARRDDPSSLRAGGTRARLLHLSDDGTEVTVAAFEGDFRFANTRFQVWDARAGVERTSGAWPDPELARLASVGVVSDSGMWAALTHPGGREFLSDAEAWGALRGRMTTARAAALDDLRRTVRPVADGEVPHVFPDSFCLAADGRAVAYVCRNGWPLYAVSESLGDGTAVEDARTGRRLTFLPGVTNGVVIAPGCRTAVSRHDDGTRGGERPLLVLWDLTASRRRAELLVGSSTPQPVYSPDGRHVFARTAADLRWWETDTGRHVGRAEGVVDWVLLEGGRVLVTLPIASVSAAGAQARLGFWDVGTGAGTGEWEPPAGRDVRRLSSGAGSHLAAVCDASSELAFGGEQSAVVLWDVAGRREVCRLPGSSAVLSADGRWVATIDDDGVARVWEVPPPRAWRAATGYAALATAACWASVLLVRARRGRRR